MSTMQRQLSLMESNGCVGSTRAQRHLRRSDTVANACSLLSLGEGVCERHLFDSGALLYFQRMQLPWLMPYLRFRRRRLSLEVEEMRGGGVRVSYW